MVSSGAGGCGQRDANKNIINERWDKCGQPIMNAWDLLLCLHFPGNPSVLVYSSQTLADKIITKWE